MILRIPKLRERSKGLLSKTGALVFKHVRDDPS